MPIDYSKFDNIPDSEDEEPSGQQAGLVTASKRSPTYPPASSTEPRRPPGIEKEFLDPLWGGAEVKGETMTDRLQRLIPVPHLATSYRERAAKAQEMFRLGYLIYLETNWSNAAIALVEGLLMDDRSLPKQLAIARVAVGPESCVFGEMIKTLEQHAPENPTVCWDLNLALLAVHWLDMQMLLARELVERAGPDVDVAHSYQQRWFGLLVELDETARKAVARCSEVQGADARILSRLTLVQAQYGGNPPCSKPKKELAKLTQTAVDLWPQDVMALSWNGRRQDLEVLVGNVQNGFRGLLEPDAPERKAMQERLATMQAH